ncbi:MAG: dTMP kinase [Bdellovibrionales bacterium]|nr:dTMP kinase [Bdellovibrionales bacterium]
MKFSKKPRFITFEGTEGSGKSTLIQQLAVLLRSHGIPVVVTREPGGSAVAEKIRQIILHEKMDPKTELLLYEASRAEHLAEKIRPALAQGQWVLCDRYTDSTHAYQGTARGIPVKEIDLANRLATDGLKPDLTVFLDIDPAAGLKSAVDPNRFEAEGVAFQKKVRQGFLKLIKKEKKRFLVMKAKKASPEVMAQEIFQWLQKVQKQKR